MSLVNRKKENFIKSLKDQSLPLLKTPYLKWMCLNGFLLFGVFSVLNGLFAWIPDILNRVMSEDSTGKTACDVIFDRLNQTISDDDKCNDKIDEITFILNTIANLSCFVIAIAVSSLVKFVDKKILLLLLYITIGTFCILINFVTRSVLFAVLLSPILILSLAIGPITAYSVQIFPASLRGMAVSLTMMVGRMGSIFGANITGSLLNVACEATFYSFGCLLIFCGILSFFLPNSKGFS